MSRQFSTLIISTVYIRAGICKVLSLHMLLVIYHTYVYSKVEIMLFQLSFNLTLRILSTYVGMHIAIHPVRM